MRGSPLQKEQKSLTELWEPNKHKYHIAYFDWEEKLLKSLVYNKDFVK